MSEETRQFDEAVRRSFYARKTKPKITHYCEHCAAERTFKFSHDEDGGKIEVYWCVGCKNTRWFSV